MIETDKVELNDRSIQFIARCSDLNCIYKPTTQICPDTISSVGIGLFHGLTFLGGGERTDLFWTHPQANVRVGLGMNIRPREKKWFVSGQS